MPPTTEQIYEYAESHANQILAAAQANEFIGLCVICGEETYHVDPDACGDPCPSCESKAVYGAQELMLYAFC